MTSFLKPKTALGRTLLGAVIGGLVGALLCGLYLAGTFERAELATFDARVNWLGNDFPADQIAIVLIDQYSLERVDEMLGEQWPWNRAAYGMMVNYFNQAGARAVVFDFIFSEKQQDPYGEQDFADAMALDIPVILAGHSDEMTIELSEKAPELLQRFSVEVNGTSTTRPAETFVPPIDLYAENCQGLFQEDFDTKIRRAMVTRPSAQGHFLGLPFATYRALYPGDSLNLDEGRATFGDLTIPVDANSLACLNLPGNIDSVTPYNAAAIFKSVSTLNRETTRFSPSPISRIASSSSEPAPRASWISASPPIRK
jgi:adenylate cyclase